MSSHSQKFGSQSRFSIENSDLTPRGQQLHGGKATASVHTYTSEWETRCSHWLKDDDSLYSTLVRANPPSKNWLQIYLTPFEIVFRQIPVIPPGRSFHATPHDEKLSYDEFEILDETEPANMKSTILTLLGRTELDYISGLMLGHIDFLDRLPHKVIVKIALYLDFKSICRLSQTNKNMHKVCNSDAVWVKLFTMHSGEALNYDWALRIQTSGMKSAILMDPAVLRKMLINMRHGMMLDKQAKQAQKDDGSGASRRS